jgi:hypothetical protein
MEPKGSLPHSQAPAICPYPEPDQSNPFLLIPLPVWTRAEEIQYTVKTFAILNDKYCLY